MSRRSLIRWISLIAITCASYWAVSEVWTFRHYYSVRGDIDDAIASAAPIIAALEADRARTGSYPTSVPQSLVSATHAGVLDWYYVRSSNGMDYELYTPHNGWVSSFNALVYSPDKAYAADWLSLDHKYRRGWLYVIGGSDLRSRW